MAKKPNIDKLVQELVDAAANEGIHEARGTYPMQGAYDRTHAARNALMDAIDKLPTRGMKGLVMANGSPLLDYLNVGDDQPDIDEWTKGYHEARRRLYRILAPQLTPDAKCTNCGATDGVTPCGNTPYDEGPFTIDHERTAFEAAMRAKHPEWAFTSDPVFDYHNERTRCAWEGWQAARTSGVEDRP